MKRYLFPILIIASMIFSLSGPIRPAQASSTIKLPDTDQDGISNAMELAGWYNLAGGPYVTNPNMADTDQDGLTDAQEKLFNTNPLDPHSPGIAVPYNSAYKTFEYYSLKDPAYLAMVQGGNQYLLKEGFVVRRGTTFKVAALTSAGATLTVSGVGFAADLSAVRDAAQGGWNVTIPADGKVGTYSATITVGTWTQSMPIYVIFALPTDMSAAQVNAYVYDDDPANTRDEVAVWWRAVDWKYYNNDSVTPTPCAAGDPICSDWQYHTISGYAQAFHTEQFTKNVLMNFTLPAINGLASPYTAALAIGDKADASVRVNFSSVKNSFSSATKVYYFPNDPLHPTSPYRTDGGGCETSAGVYTSMLRSAGIPSQPFALDYNKTPGHGESGNFGVFEYDTAVTMWVKGSGDSANLWYAERTFNGAESEYQATPSWTSGALAAIRPLASVGIYAPAGSQFKHFQDIFADAIQMANEGWDFQNGSAGGGMVNTEWTGIDVPGTEFVYQNRDFKWNSKYPLQIQQSPDVTVLNCQVWKGDGWAPSEWYAPADPLYLSNPVGRTALQTYFLPPNVGSTPGDIENWPYNPQPTSCSDSTSPAACAAFKATQSTICAPLPGQSSAAVQSIQPSVPQTQAVNATLNTTVQLGNILSDSAIDLNGDGRFDQLVVTFQVSAVQAGEYQLSGWLRAGDKQIRADNTSVTLKVGSQTVQITFDGQAIGDNKVNGPYQVEAIWAASASQPVSEQALPEEMAAYQTYSYQSQVYPASAFNVLAASVLGNYSYTTADTNSNGLVDTIRIAVPLNIAIAGTFSLDGDLYDGTGGFVGHAVWTGAGPDATLEFKVSGTNPPYSLAHLNLLDAKGKELNSFYSPVFSITDLNGKVDLGNVTPGNSSTGIMPQTITPTNVFTVTPVDLNGNGRFDQLNISAAVNVTVTGGSYWMEGLLVDDRNLPVAWSVSAPQPLAVGQNQSIQMSFDTKMLIDTLPLTGSLKFTLIAVKIFSGTPGNATLEADIPVPGFDTPAYSRSQFEPSSLYSPYPDDIANGTPLLSASGSSQWSQTTTIWHSWTSAWVAVGSTSKNGLLSLSPINLTKYASPWLWFNTSYVLLPGQSAVLEASTDGSNWTTLKTYTGSTTYWSSELVDLSAYGKKAGVLIRFNAKSYAGLSWSVADIFVKAGPAIQSASFVYTGPVKTGNNVVLTADYVSINKTLPMSYEWNFCGSSRTTTSSAIGYVFTAVGNCLVTVVVDNGYDKVTSTPQTIQVGLGTFHTYLPVLAR